MAAVRDIYSRFHRADKFALIGETDGRKLYHIVINGPGNEPMELYAGEAYMVINGRQVLTPEEPQFWSESKALAWLKGEKG